MKILKDEKGPAAPGAQIVLVEVTLMVPPGAKVEEFAKEASMALASAVHGSDLLCPEVRVSHILGVVALPPKIPEGIVPVGAAALPPEPPQGGGL